MFTLKSVYFCDSKTMHCKFQNDSLISGFTYPQITNIFQCFTANSTAYSLILSLISSYFSKTASTANLFLINKFLVNWCTKLSGR